jgi:hypothetical protein
MAFDFPGRAVFEEWSPKYGRWVWWLLFSGGVIVAFGALFYAGIGAIDYTDSRFFGPKIAAKLPTNTNEPLIDLGKGGGNTVDCVRDARGKGTAVAAGQSTGNSLHDIQGISPGQPIQSCDGVGQMPRNIDPSLTNLSRTALSAKIIAYANELDRLETPIPNGQPSSAEMKAFDDAYAREDGVFMSEYRQRGEALRNAALIELNHPMTEYLHSTTYLLEPYTLHIAGHLPLQSLANVMRGVASTLVANP